MRYQGRKRQSIDFSRWMIVVLVVAAAWFVLRGPGPRHTQWRR